MRKLMRKGLSLLVVGVGIASLLATSRPPFPQLGVRTLNNFGEPYTPVTIFACEGEEVELYWHTYGEGGWTLRAKPPESFSPPLSPRQVAVEGILRTVVLARANLVFTPPGSDSSRGRPLEVLPDRLCNGFDFPLIGWYTGELEQSAPSAESLPRQLRLTYVDEIYRDLPTGLRLIIADDVATANDYTAACSLGVSAEISCQGEAFDGSSFELSATVTPTGLEGSYSGTRVDTGSVVTYEGTLSFIKQPGIPDLAGQP